MQQKRKNADLRCRKNKFKNFPDCLTECLGGKWKIGRMASGNL
jgi:hypothetical protein